MTGGQEGAQQAPLAAVITVQGINSSVRASSQHGDYYRCGLDPFQLHAVLCRGLMSGPSMIYDLVVVVVVVVVVG